MRDKTGSAELGGISAKKKRTIAKGYLCQRTLLTSLSLGCLILVAFRRAYITEVLSTLRAQWTSNVANATRQRRDALRSEDMIDFELLKAKHSRNLQDENVNSNRPTAVPTFTKTPTISPRPTTTRAPTQRAVTRTPTTTAPTTPFPTVAPTNTLVAPTHAPTRAPSRQLQAVAQPITEQPSISAQPTRTFQPTAPRPTKAPTGTLRPILPPTPKPIDDSTAPQFSRGTLTPLQEDVSPTLAPTRTFRPTPRRPTRKPSRSPTVIRDLAPPSGAPLPQLGAPTSSPSRAQTISSPTNRPITLQPVADPTWAPIASNAMPSLRPTHKPTSQPAQISSSHPTDKPVRAPIFWPTSRPTPKPSTATAIPTPAPWRRPSVPPGNPISRPVEPTPRPTRRPTRTPNSLPTTAEIPSPEPTAWSGFGRSLPSLAPNEVSPVPTLALQVFPSTLVPTEDVTGLSLTTLPAPSPTRSPAPGDVKVFQFMEATGRSTENQMLVYLDTSQILSRRMQASIDQQVCIAVWQRLMEDHIRSEILTVTPRAEEAIVNLTSVELDSLIEKGTLIFFFDVIAKVRSPLSEIDANRYVIGAFDSQDARNSFASALRSSSDCPQFAYTTSVQILLPTSSSSAAAGNDAANAGLIVGIVAAVVAGAMLTALFVIARMRKRRAFRYDANMASRPLSGLDEAAHEYGSEIGLRTAAEVSTLSDPMPGGAVAADGSSTIDSFSLDYDYQKAYEGSVSDPSAGSYSYPDSVGQGLVATDDGTLDAQYALEEQIQVIAPAGVLGLVLESNEDGVPIVNSIKNTSVLIDQVRVGDRLILVDNIDVTVMLASDVSKLIASKKHKPERRLMFARPRKWSDVGAEDGFNDLLS